MIKKLVKNKEKISLLLVISVFAALTIFGIIKERGKNISEEQILEVKKEIEEQNESVEIFYKDWDKKEKGFEYELTDDMDEVYAALEDIKEILDRLPEGIVEEVLRTPEEAKANTVVGSAKAYQGVNIVICSEIYEENIGVYVTTGLTNYNYRTQKYNIYIAVKSTENVKRVFAHELYHFFQNRIIVKNREEECYTSLEWQKELPDNFSYYETYDTVISIDSKYTAEAESNIENVYFVTTYSKKKDEEDKCELFSYLLSSEGKSDLPRAYKSSHVKKRVKMIIDELDEYFDTVDENAYWNKIYNEKVLNY